MGRLIGRGEIDPRELLEAFLDGIRNCPGTDDIYVRVTADRAFAEAEAASRRAETGRPPVYPGWCSDFMEGPLRHRGHRHRGRKRCC